MLSRIADSLFWLNRYMERADCMLRILNVHYRLSLDRDVNENKIHRASLALPLPYAGIEMAALQNNQQHALQYLLTDPRNPDSLKTILSRARENARGAQDHITKEVWEEVNQFFHQINHSSVSRQLNGDDAFKVIEMFIKHSVMYTGIAETTMSRGQGWDFMNLGKYIERCLQTIAVTQQQLQVVNGNGQEVNDILQWRYLLLTLSGYEMHLKTYGSTDHNYNVMYQVVLDPHFAHSILYALQRIKIYLKRVAKKQAEESSELQRAFGRLFSKVQYMNLADLDKVKLDPFLEEIKSELVQFNTALSKHFFSYY